MAVLFVCFYKNPSEKSLFSINVFDTVSAITTYLGTTLLAVIVWHNTWLQTREKENESAIRVHAEIEINMESGNCVFQQNDIKKININITNQNICVPIRIKFVKAFELQKTKVSPIKPHYISYESDEKLLSFNENEKFSVAFKEEEFLLPKHFYFCFYINNANGHQVYCIVDCHLDQNGWCSDIYKNGTLVDVYKFHKLKEKFGYDFIKEIVWYSPVGWKKKNINRIYLFKVKKIKEKEEK